MDPVNQIKYYSPQLGFLKSSNIAPFSLDSDSPFFIGICGGTSAGKYTLVKYIQETLTKEYNKTVTIIDMANFYKEKSELNTNQIVDYDHPSSIDFKLLREAVDKLLGGETIKVPIYDKIEEKKTNKEIEIIPGDAILLSGVLSFYDEELRKKYKLKIFLDTDEDVRLSKRVYQDVILDKKNIESVINYYLQFVKPDYEKFVQPFKKFADVIIPNFGGGISFDPDDKINQLGMESEVIHPVIHVIVEWIGKVCSWDNQKSTKTNQQNKSKLETIKECQPKKEFQQNN